MCNEMIFSKELLHIDLVLRVLVEKKNVVEYYLKRSRIDFFMAYIIKSIKNLETLCRSKIVACPN